MNLPSLHLKSVLGAAELLGIAAGRAALERLGKAAPTRVDAPALLLDMSGMELVTASAARESLLKLSEVISQAGALPVFVNVNAATLDELRFAAEALKQPVVVASTDEQGSLTGAFVIGTLEPTQRETLEVVSQLEEADAKTASQAAESAAGVTAWNNRLSNLASLRLLQERKVGKTKLYSLTVKGLAYGN
ncbi:hypothetical protein [Ramlibacter humi]|uniref:Uncharacterized protein n=1 Tax=Ramlibacter humi TaxID=2530451 RepID=A0A4Z0CBA2_9BURK|nr:hypothetical protein [Ramlibacter humi]TFZ08936.1 hypothetical protein EZ216_07280 [Ramlibacter humi]